MDGSPQQVLQHFPAVELQTTFYQPPSPELARKWREEAPPDFIFALKAWQTAHVIAQALRAAVIVFQCPPRSYG